MTVKESIKFKEALRIQLNEMEMNSLLPDGYEIRGIGDTYVLFFENRRLIKIYDRSRNKNLSEGLNEMRKFISDELISIYNVKDMMRYIKNINEFIESMKKNIPVTECILNWKGSIDDKEHKL